MGEVEQINIKNWTYYFINNIIDLKNFDAGLLKIEKEIMQNIGIYNIKIKEINQRNKYWWVWLWKRLHENEI